VVIDLVLIPAFDAVGAAVATGVVAVVVCIVFDRLNRHTLGTGTPGPGAPLLISSAVGGAVMLAGSSIGNGWLGFVGLAVLPLLLLATRVVTVDDLRRLGRLVARGNRA
jgi:peptidoglycan biosynthesis protein MviN/MurJ (putative lipid II flippase)